MNLGIALPLASSRNAGFPLASLLSNKNRRDASDRGATRLSAQVGADRETAPMKSSELPVLAGGAAAALIAGIASAALGLAPMRASLARYGAEARHIALRQSPDAAATEALRVAVSSSDPSPSAGHAV